jgi:hypothetical protein
MPELTIARHAPMSPRPIRRRRTKHVSLFQFFAGGRGLKPCAELAYIFDGNPFVPGFGALLRAGGMELDTAREAAVEARYLADPGFDDCCEATSTVNDLLELLALEAHGAKQYSWGDWPTAEEIADRGEELEEEEHAPMTSKMPALNAPMSNKEFHALVTERLGLSVYAARKMLGISLSTAQRYAGQRDKGAEIPETIAILLRLIVREKIDPAELLGG